MASGKPGAVQLATILGSIAGIVGWPLLLGAGVGLVAAYWDDIGGLFTAAWAKFKQTFPETAKYLEDTFGPALQSAKTFTSDLVADFQRKFPRLTAILQSLKDNLAGGATWLVNLDWSGIFTGLKDASVATLEWLAGILERLSPLLGKIGSAIKDVIGGVAELAGAVWEGGGDKTATSVGGVLKMGVEETANIVGGLGMQDANNVMNMLNGGFMYDIAELSALSLWDGVFGASDAAPAPAQAAPGGTPFTINIEGQRVIQATTQDPAAGARLAAQMAAGSRASITGGGR